MMIHTELFHDGYFELYKMAFIKELKDDIRFTYFVEAIRGLRIKQTLLSNLLYSFVAQFSFVVAFIGIGILVFKKEL